MNEQELFESQFDEKRDVIRTDFEPGTAPRPFAPEDHVPYLTPGVGDFPEPVINPREVRKTPLPPEDEPEEPVGTDPSTIPGIIADTTAQQQAADGHLAFDSFMGEVVSVNYGATKVDVHSIVARRSRISYGTNNDPKIGPVPAPDDDPQKARLEAYPYPPRHDQAAYIVQAGDPVMLFTGKDGRHYFLSDDLPFVGRVAAKFYGTFTAAITDTITQTAHGMATGQGVFVATTDTLPAGLSLNTEYFVKVLTADTYTLHPTAADAVAGTNTIDITTTGTGVHNTFHQKESQAGGAGLLSLRVLRQAMSGDPGSAGFQGATLAALQDADSVNVYVNNVLVIAPETHGHGYRVGDKVIVQRRGRYYFVLPGRETFAAEIQTGGPAGEDDFTLAAGRAGDTNHYWVQEQDTTVAYDASEPNEWTYTNANRAALDPLGLSGAKGRWVDAVNLGESATSHELSQYTEVIVTMVADPATGEVAYFFDHATEDDDDHTILNSARHTDTVGNHAVAQGDLIVGNSTPKWDALAIGDEDDLLAVSGGVPIWRASGRKDYLINGNWLVDQRYTYSGGALLDNAYVSSGDHWRALEDAGVINFGTTVTRDTGTLGSAEGYVRLISTGGTYHKVGLFQVVESRRLAGAHGKKLTFSVYINDEGTSRHVKMAIVGWSGTADGTQADPISSWNAVDTTPTMAANWTLLNTPATINTTSTSTRYSVTTTAAVDETYANVAVFMWVDDTGSTALRFRKAQLEDGEQATAFAFVPLDQDLAACQRYYQKTFPQSVAPATNLDDTTGACEAFGSTGSGDCHWSWDFAVVMLEVSSPTITTFCISETNSNAWNQADDSNAALDASDASDRRWFGRYSDASWAADASWIHVTVEAEL